ncbi:hypothetical protein [Specibacter cremeus]|uniref:hypothetical protein n=1 Tax=Specibacter cremeus TaxID=1629051 RepID=UPI001F0C89AC|nr:hypothetical protein [Specibacter cremeus]
MGGKPFIVMAEAVAADEPGEGAFDNPAPGQGLDGVRPWGRLHDRHGALQHPSARTGTIEGIVIRAAEDQPAPSWSCRLAAVTGTTTSRPVVPPAMRRLQPVAFFLASHPRGGTNRVVDPVAGDVGGPPPGVPIHGVPGRDVVP